MEDEKENGRGSKCIVDNDEHMEDEEENIGNDNTMDAKDTDQNIQREQLVQHRGETDSNEMDDSNAEDEYEFERESENKYENEIQTNDNPEKDPDIQHLQLIQEREEADNSE